MGTWSLMHWFVIGAVALLLFGNRLPEVARSIGRSVNEFKKGLKEVQEDVEDEEGDKPPPRRLRSPADERRATEEPPAERDREPVVTRNDDVV